LSPDVYQIAKMNFRSTKGVRGSYEIFISCKEKCKEKNSKKLEQIKSMQHQRKARNMKYLRVFTFSSLYSRHTLYKDRISATQNSSSFHRYVHRKPAKLAGKKRRKRPEAGRDIGQTTRGASKSDTSS
jgi:hypothetical protein